MGEYMSLLTQVKQRINEGDAATACSTLKKLLNMLNDDYIHAAIPAEREKVKGAIKRLLPVLEDLKNARLSYQSAALLGVSVDALRPRPAEPLNIPPRPSLDEPVAPARSKPANDYGYAPPKPSVEPKSAPATPIANGKPAAKPFKATTGRANNAMIPLTFDDYIGQEKAKKSLTVSVTAAKKTGRPLAHTLICSSYGLGKTTLANIVANMMDMPFFNVNATNLKDVKALSLYFSKIEQSCIIFIDEIHSLKKDVQTVLLSIITDFAVSYLDENGESVRVELPPFTLIGATTQAGELLKPFLNRFAVIELEDYTEEEKQLLVRTKLDKLGYQATDGAIDDIARRCRGVPRTIETFVRGVNDLALVADSKIITDEMTAEYFDMMEIDPLGLTKNDRRLLSILADAERPMALVTLESKSGIQHEDLELRYEPYLIKLGFVDKTDRGRIITARGMAYINGDEPAPEPAKPIASGNGGKAVADDAAEPVVSDDDDFALFPDDSFAMSVEDNGARAQTDGQILPANDGTDVTDRNAALDDILGGADDE